MTSGVRVGHDLRMRKRTRRESQIIAALAGETGCSLPTIRKWLRDPDSVHLTIDYALRIGTGQLGIADEVDDLSRQHAAPAAEEVA